MPPVTPVQDCSEILAVAVFALQDDFTVRLEVDVEEVWVSSIYTVVGALEV